MEKKLPHQGTTVILDDPHKGISLVEMEKKELGTIQHEIGNDGAIRFACRNVRLSASVTNLDVKRLYKRKSDGNVVVFYAMKGDLNGVSVETLNAVKDILKSLFCEDYEIHFLPSAPVMTKQLQARVDMNRKMVYIFCEMKFERAWEPDPVFQEVK